ncbi:MAG: bifunctional diaminohydroxyphosphoribosylaminopyrimidine deaminase/5-amino-6-(5-phosphoribosylamino)uracil reductase RibD [Bacteroidia bacterium]|jgi:diaminohydroxyphosphoribosylaminopyrimidine deaminase/5-amino-6-(5-phosphoribosylamino)uracil reductase
MRKNEISYLYSMEEYMRRALELAARGMGSVAPNPMVGCVIVHNNQIIGEGWHRKFGGPHAEVHAIDSVKDKTLLSEATLFVTLEPCSHHGKTPPCSNFIVASGIKNVAIATKDTFSEVSGAGIKYLQAQGVKVSVGILEAEARILNRRFFTFHEKKRPYIILKWAQSADGFIDKKRVDGEHGQFKLTGMAAQVLVHQYRSEESAILVGRRTIEIDDPQLNTRLWPGKNPLRVVLDPHMKLGSNYRVFTDASPTWHMVLEQPERKQTDTVKLCSEKTYLNDVLRHLYEAGIQSVLVEGGKYTLNRFLNEDLFDEIRVFKSENLLGDGLPAPTLSSGKFDECCIGKDILLIGTF